MTRSYTKSALLTVFLTLIYLAPAVAADTVTSQQLLNDPLKYNERDIIYEGEAIGDIMKRPGGQWVNVLNNGTAIGVWSTKDLKGVINITGNYKAAGDIVEVTGIFNRMCEEHGGDLDIHAVEMTVLTPGRTIEHKVNIKRVQAAILLTIGAMLAFGFNLSRARRYL